MCRPYSLDAYHRPGVLALVRSSLSAMLTLSLSFFLSCSDCARKKHSYSSLAWLLDVRLLDHHRSNLCPIAACSHRHRLGNDRLKRRPGTVAMARQHMHTTYCMCAYMHAANWSLEGYSLRLGWSCAIDVWFWHWRSRRLSGLGSAEATVDISYTSYNVAIYAWLARTLLTSKSAALLQNVGWKQLKFTTVGPKWYNSNQIQ